MPLNTHGEVINEYPLYPPLDNKKTRLITNESNEEIPIGQESVQIENKVKSTTIPNQSIKIFSVSKPTIFNYTFPSLELVSKIAFGDRNVFTKNTTAEANEKNMKHQVRTKHANDPQINNDSNLNNHRKKRSSTAHDSTETFPSFLSIYTLHDANNAHLLRLNPMNYANKLNKSEAYIIGINDMLTKQPRIIRNDPENDKHIASENRFTLKMEDYPSVLELDNKKKRQTGIGQSINGEKYFITDQSLIERLNNIYFISNNPSLENILNQDEKSIIQGNINEKSKLKNNIKIKTTDKRESSSYSTVPKAKKPSKVKNHSKAPIKSSTSIRPTPRESKGSKKSKGSNQPKGYDKGETSSPSTMSYTKKNKKTKSLPDRLVDIGKRTWRGLKELSSDVVMAAEGIINVSMKSASAAGNQVG